jgi:hypothetical protein
VLEKIVSGGQSGVDRAALDAARAAGLACGGWCPRERWAEDGPIPARYPLVETPLRDPAQRTAWNVRDADATLVLTRGAPRGGTAFTLDCARTEGRPCRVVDLESGADAAEIAGWLGRNSVRVLNVAGPRESQAPGIHADALSLLREVLADARAVPRGEEQGPDDTSR